MTDIKKYCMKCGVPEESGYILDGNFRSEDFEHSFKEAHHTRFIIDSNNYFDVFHLAGTSQIFLPYSAMDDTLHKTGLDLTHDIDIDHPLYTVVLADGKCKHCIAEEAQLKLF